MQWHYKIYDEVRGPLSEFELHKMAKRGKLHPNDLVRPDKEGAEWKPANEIPGLIEEKKTGGGLSMASRPGSTIRKKIQTVRMLIKGTKRVNVLAEKMDKFSEDHPDVPPPPPKKKLEFASKKSLYLIILLVGGFLYLHQSGKLSGVYMKVSSVIGVDMSEQAVRARSMAFARLLINLRNKPEYERQELVNEFVVQNHLSPAYVKKLCDKYGPMTKDHCAVSASVQNANVSPSSQRAVVVMTVTMLKDGERYNSSLQVIWQVVGSDWYCLPN